MEAGLHLAERRGLAVTALRARLNLGIFLVRDDPRAALENNRVGLAEAHRLGQRAYALTFLTNAAAGAIATGDWDWALPELEELLTSELEREERILVLEAVLSVRDWRGQRGSLGRRTHGRGARSLRGARRPPRPASRAHRARTRAPWSAPPARARS